MAGAILGPHIINGAAPHLALLRRWQPRLVLLLDPNGDDARALRVVCPQTYIVGRIYVPDGEMENRIRGNPEDAAHWVHSQIVNHPARPSISAWQVTNEILQFWDGVPLLMRFNLAWMKLADAAGYHCAIDGWSVGQPELPADDRMALWRLGDEAHEHAEAHDHVVALHQYGAPDLWGPAEKGGADWLIHRLEHQVLPRLPQTKLKFVVTEYGIDGLLLNTRSVGLRSTEYGAGVTVPTKNLFSATRGTMPSGWSNYTDAADYATRLTDIGQYCEQWSNQIIGYAIFTLGHNAPWNSYDIVGDVAERLTVYYETHRGDPTPDPDPGGTMSDPRAENCRQFATVNDKVTGIKLVYESVPTARYACISAQLIDEDAAQGNTVVTVDVLNKDGVKISERTFMTWPYGEAQAPEAPLGPGNPQNQFATQSAFPSTKIGPLGFFVGDANKQPISDKIWGYGLPDNRHISGYVVFKERSAEEPPTTYTTLAESVKGEAEKYDVLAVNPNAALCKAGLAAELWPTSNEYEWIFGGISYTGQRFRDPASNAVTAFYCVTGKWDKVLRQDW